MSELSHIIEGTMPSTGPVKIKKEALVENFNGFRIVQSGGKFRLHGTTSAITLDPLDALWVIDKRMLGAKRSEVFRRVVVWEDFR